MAKGLDPAPFVNLPRRGGSISICLATIFVLIGMLLRGPVAERLFTKRRGVDKLFKVCYNGVFLGVNPIVLWG